MKQYLKLIKHVLERGEEKEDRTGTGTLSVFGYQMRFNLLKGFPLVTTKQCHTRSIIHELLFFLGGHTNNKYLLDRGVTIWRAWADENDELGRIYSAQWRSWRGANGMTVDQIANVVRDLKTSPDSRRLIVSAWNPAELDEMALPPCHALYQFYTSKLTVDERYTLYREKMDRWQLEINRRACENPEDDLANLYTNLHISPRDWFENNEFGHLKLDEQKIPRRKLSCQLYQRKQSCAFVA